MKFEIIKPMKMKANEVIAKQNKDVAKQNEVVAKQNEVVSRETKQLYIRSASKQKKQFFTKFPDGKDIEPIIENLFDPEEDVLISPRIFGRSLAIQALYNGEKFILPYMLLYYHNRSLTKNFGTPASNTGTIGIWIGGKSPFAEIFSYIPEPSQPTNVFIKFIWQPKEDACYILEPIKFGKIEPFFQLYKTLVKSDFQKIYEELSPKIEKFDFFRSAGCAISVFSNIKNAPVIIIDKKVLQFTDFIGVDKEKMLVENIEKPAFVVSSFGITPKQAVARCYENLRKIYLPNCFFRTDIGQAWFKTKYPTL